MTRRHRKWLPWGLLCLVVVLFVATDAYGLTLRANSVPNLTTQDVFTVPAGKAFLVTSIVVANTNTSATCCARLFKNGVDLTGFITVPAGASFQAVFSPGIRYNAGQIIQVRNGDSTGPIHFTINLQPVTP